MSSLSNIGAALSAAQQQDPFAQPRLIDGTTSLGVAPNLALSGEESEIVTNADLLFSAEKASPQPSPHLLQTAGGLSIEEVAALGVEFGLGLSGRRTMHRPPVAVSHTGISHHILEQSSGLPPRPPQRKPAPQKPPTAAKQPIRPPIGAALTRKESGKGKDWKAPAKSEEHPEPTDADCADAKVILSREECEELGISKEQREKINSIIDDAASIETHTPKSSNIDPALLQLRDDVLTHIGYIPESANLIKKRLAEFKSITDGKLPIEEEKKKLMEIDQRIMEDLKYY